MRPVCLHQEFLEALINLVAVALPGGLIEGAGAGPAVEEGSACVSK